VIARDEAGGAALPPTIVVGSSAHAWHDRRETSLQ
jgi:hypothetical protein